MTQWIKQQAFSSSGNILDIVLTSEEDRNDNVEMLPSFPKCCHSPACFSCIFQNLVERPYNKPRLKWHKGNFQAINDRLGDTDWDLLFAHLSVEEIYVEYIKTITNATYIRAYNT